MDTNALFSLALEASKRAYAPYSGFHVGAALVAEDGTVFTGANIENRSFGLTICAERSALVAAVSAGHRSFVGVFVATPDGKYPVSPCGACRQSLSEFMGAEAKVVFGSKAGDLVETTIGALLPNDALHDLKDASR
jgi:cytidine deaminase